MRIVKPTDFGRRADAIVAGVTGDFAVDDTMELPLVASVMLVVLAAVAAGAPVRSCPHVPYRSGRLWRWW